MPISSNYPTGGVYREAIQNTYRCFKDPTLIGGQPVVDSLGLPKPISGNNATVFTIRGNDGRRWAIKCFTRYVDDQGVRFERITQTLAPVDKQWRIAFEYAPAGVLCGGNWYPILKMEWIEASGLISYIEAHLWQPPVLANLATKFAQLVQDLGQLGIAHGDLQHGNLLVTPSGELKLIDYDGMYVPGLEQHGASESGHANYQSPARTNSSWGPNLDRFSAWVIYASLVALTIDPTLWTLLHNEGDEALLFRKEDFLDPLQSRALVLLSQCTDERLKTLRDVVAAFWTNDLGNVPVLSPAAAPAPNRQQTFVQAATDGHARATDVSDASVAIADWLSSMQRSSPGDAEAANDPSWLLPHLPSVEAHVFEPKSSRLRALVGIYLVALVALVIFAILGTVPIDEAGVADGLATIVLLSALGIAFRRNEESRAKRNLAATSRQRRAAVSSANKAASKAEKDRRSIEQREGAAIEKARSRVNDTRESERRQVKAAEEKLTSRTSRIASQKQSLESAESAEIGNTLRLLQDQHLVAQLSTASIRSATIPGIGRALKSALNANGIITAADFTGISYGTGSEVLINLRNGRPVHPRGIGEAKAIALDSWRREIESRARRSQPSALPAAQAQAIRLRYAQRRQSLAQEEHHVQAEAATAQHRIRERWVATDRAISAEIAQTRQAFVREREGADLRLERARRDARDVTWQQTLTARDLNAYREVTYWKYCKCVVRG